MEAVKVENLSKLYYLGGKRQNSLRDAIMSFVSNPLHKHEKQELLALNNVSFTLNEGETLGIIGKNGAGKSTLLKILSRITKPTSGGVDIRGRVASLLEVGTGFHSELSGRENIFLNGAVLGMKRLEIEQKFDEIVAFAEVEKFIDTPVKHYSSGMYMRLAFAVAAHLEPEILIVDEVLAVGDLSFQRKCLNKMRDVSQNGRTVLFVSHNMQAVTRLCSRAIWITNGEIVLDGTAQEVVGKYLQTQADYEGEKVWNEIDKAPGDEFVKLHRVRAMDKLGSSSVTFDIRYPIILEMTYEVLCQTDEFTTSFHIYNDEGFCVFVSNDINNEWRNKKRDPGIYTSQVEIPGNFMSEGTFSTTTVAFSNSRHHDYFFERDVIGFNIFDTMCGDSARGDFSGNMIGIVRPVLTWQTEFKDK